MLTGILDHGALRTARAALTGLTRRHEAVSANIANIDTPGYQRRAVDFEHALATSLERSAAGALTRTHDRHLAPGAGGGGVGSGAQRDVVSARNDANSVSIDEEMTLLAETQIRYQALTQTVGKRLGALRTAIRG